MRRSLTILGLAAAALLAYATVAVVATRSYQPSAGELAIERPPALPDARDTVTVLSFNLGYAGLGAEADFIADGGTHVLPASSDLVARNLAGIRGLLIDSGAGVMLLQEVARSSPLNYWADILADLDKSLAPMARVYSVDVNTQLLPPPLAVVHGKATYSAYRVAASTRLALPLEDEFLLGFVRNNYNALVTRLPLAGSDRSWVFINVHLAAFDAEGSVRRDQLAAVLRHASAEYAIGNAVIIGGDFNLEFVRSPFPHRAGPEFLFWLHDFPLADLAPGWSAVFDRDTPSARTLYAPYEPGVTYTTIIDGFIVSPNVEVGPVEVIDTGFAFSDHQPVTATFRLRSG